MARSNTTELLEALAAELGENIYLDIAKWHLHLENAKLHTPLAEQLYPLLAAGPIQEDQVIRILSTIPVKIGGGKKEIPLVDLLPMQCQVTLIDILERFQKDL
ncbi:thylakoid-associated protein [Leptolyngbya sp. 'hensonii']|uniref:DUF3181 family protein n=1 Tax=Leptolyngbya sp. 'hensonii' TaxID=1922337 RepID=UPI00094FC480|nr:DUF3181 family protein [Leptolyngbya sp. 'hensonii']OLP16460.1 thylakoid-associated protein [Leptolyngbya sp. 'hensonii']